MASEGKEKEAVEFEVFMQVNYRCLLRSGAMLQIGRSLVRSQLVSVDFFIDINSFRSHNGPGVDSASNRNE